MTLSATMYQAMGILARGPSTATWVGSELTGRRSAYGPQTSAREGGRTLRALQRRKLAEVNWHSFHQKFLWSLTPAGWKEWRSVQGQESKTC